MWSLPKVPEASRSDSVQQGQRGRPDLHWEIHSSGPGLPPRDGAQLLGSGQRPWGRLGRDGSTYCQQCSGVFPPGAWVCDRGARPVLVAQVRCRFLETTLLLTKSDFSRLTLHSRPGTKITSPCLPSVHQIVA